MATQKLVAGDWLKITYGGSRDDVYITRTASNGIWFCKTTWLSYDDSFISLHNLNQPNNHYNPTYVGRGRKKWYWKYLLFKETTVPYTYPNLKPSDLELIWSVIYTIYKNLLYSLEYKFNLYCPKLKP